MIPPSPAAEPLLSKINLSSTNKFETCCCTVSPYIVKSPFTVRLSPIVTSDVPAPIDTADSPDKSTAKAEPAPPDNPVPAAPAAILIVFELASNPVPARGAAKSPIFALPSVPPSLTIIKSDVNKVADVKSLP